MPSLCALSGYLVSVSAIAQGASSAAQGSGICASSVRSDQKLMRAVSEDFSRLTMQAQALEKLLVQDQRWGEVMLPRAAK